METVLEIKDLRTSFYTREGVAKAVNGVSLTLSPGEILGVVGESGCGKSVTAFSILRLIPYPGKIDSGQIFLKNQDLLKLSLDQMRKIRGDRISMVFQEPMISLNPAFTIGDQLTEAVRVHRKVSKAEARKQAIEMLAKVDMSAPEKRIREYPHQLSGGMRQRAMIAEALLLDPNVLLADEPTTALDVTIQAQVLDIMYRLTQDMNTSIMFITHNLGIVAEFAQRVVVMYAGKIVEQGSVENVFKSPSHPYTKGLLNSIPKTGQTRKRHHQQLYEMKGIVPSLVNLPAGCSFYPRCPEKKKKCSQETPPLVTVNSGHQVYCWIN